MRLAFLDCSLDTRCHQLRRGGELRPVEPLVFDLLLHLVVHRDRTVGREELLERLWPGKVVTDAALSTCVKSARKAVGDDGRGQACIATVARRGYRFVAPVEVWADAPATRVDTPAVAAPVLPAPRACVAVMPLRDEFGWNVGPVRTYGLTHDVIAGLARLRSACVIAHGSVLELQARGLGALEAARSLQADYVVTGALRPHPRGLAVDIELADAHSGHAVWADTFVAPQDQLLAVLGDVGHAIASSLASEVEAAERVRALRQPADSLDAWLAHHRGLWHMYRFDREDNQRAREFFTAALRQDAGFSAAHAGLSFTHFQDAFQGWGDAASQARLALQSAEAALLADERQPAAHLALGRARWLLGEHDESVQTLQQAIELSPSYALAHYSLAFVQAQSGDAQAAIGAADLSRRLSPHDPLLFGMMGARAIALLRLGQFDAAADWALQAAARPNAHVHIHGIAACGLALAGRLAEARAQIAQVRRRRPGYGMTDLLAAFRFEASATRLVRDGLRRAGLD